MSTPILKARDICKAFSGVPVLENVSVAIQKGRVTCLVGENGSGKSTLIKILAGVYRRDTGSVAFNGRAYGHLKPIDAIREGIQVIYQDLSLFPNLTVAENLAMNSLVASDRTFAGPAIIRDLAVKAQRQLGMHLDLNRRIAQLPIADRQSVAIARALLEDARLIIMDEPTASLTQREIQRLLMLVNRLRLEAGVSFLFVTHKLDEVFAIADDIHVLRNGNITASGPPADFDEERLAEAMTGIKSEAASPGPGAASATRQPLLEVSGLDRPGHFHDISLRVDAGEIVGIAGLLGSGRSALAQAIFGSQPATSGTIRLDGDILPRGSIETAIERGIAYLPNDRITESLFTHQSVLLNLTSGLLKRFRNRIGLIGHSRMRSSARDRLASLGVLYRTLEQPIETLSGGNQQRVVLGSRLAHHPRLLILNGPTVGIDVGSKDAIHHLLRGLASDGIGQLIISDEMSELMRLCNRLLLMKEGRIVDRLYTKDTTAEQLSAKLLADTRRTDASPSNA